MNKTSWIIYGAYGYTGQLILEEAIRKGHKPIIAGRNAEKLRALASRFGVQSRSFGLDDIDVVNDKLKDIHTVLHCAGPFSSTHKPLLNACLASKTNYLDITGEILVFEGVQERRNEIASAGIVAIPGVGFDVVPSDCLAAQLKSLLPDATHLTFGFRYSGKPSAGTLKTIVEGLPAGGLVREAGRLKSIPAASKVREILFKKSPELCVCMPWADLSTAFYSTGIPNIEAYMALPKKAVTFLRALQRGRVLFQFKVVQKALQMLVELIHKKETEEEFSSAQAFVWGEVTNDKGLRVEKRLVAENAYKVTAQLAVAAAERVLSGKISPGAYTPSQAFGSDFTNPFSTIRFF